MISSIGINRFRGIHEGKLGDLTPLTILVGPNGCGKSSVLDAMLIGASPTPAHAVLEVVQRHEGVVTRGRWLFWRQEGMPLKAKLAVCAEKQTDRTTILTLGGSSTADSSEESYITCESSGHDPSIGSVSSIVRLMPQEDAADGMVIPSLGNVSNIRLIEAHGNGNQAPLHDLFSQSTRAGQKEDAQALITELVPGLKDIAILTEAGDPILYLLFENGAVPVAMSGDGIHAMVRLALELASLPDGVALLEEPEVHQHPGAMRQTVRAILVAVRRNVQVVLTTHSLEFIDVLLAEAKEEDIERLSLYRLELEKGRLIAVRTPGPDVAFARGEIQEDLR